MLRSVTRGAIALVVMLAAATAVAQPGPETRPVAPDEGVKIDLVTMGIGALPWERHGHIALCVTHRGMRIAARHSDPGDACYNYGIGDFHHPLAMAWGFFRGEHSFWVGKSSPEDMLQVYLYFDRTIWVQELPLDEAQRQKVIAKLEHDILEPNRYYAYDHFWDNCTTRIRDIIDDVTDHALSKMTDSPGTKTFRDLSRDGFQGFRLELLATDIELGRSTDRVPTYWERMFLPQFLREAVQTKWGIKPVPIYVRKECVASYREPDHSDPDCLERGIPTVQDQKSGRFLMALAILALTSPVWLTRLWGRFQRTGLAIAIIPYWILGVVTTTLSVLSPLPYIRPNETDLVLLVFDIAILFLPAALKVKYAKFRVGMLVVIALLLLVNVLHQPVWTLMLWPLIPMATVAFWRPRA
jgi:hypothetical protein